MPATAIRIPWWAWAWPVLACAVLLATLFGASGVFMAAAAGAVLIATVFAAVYHAEVVAHRTGEPFGTLVLALAVTVIEAALIVSVMLAAPTEKMGLARDTVFAAVMIVFHRRHSPRTSRQAATTTTARPLGPDDLEDSHDGGRGPEGKREGTKGDVGAGRVADGAAAEEQALQKDGQGHEAGEGEERVG